jgi:excisionase family DNA binding protein
VSERDGTGDVNGFLTPEEVADILRINVMTVYGYIQKANLDAVRLGRNYRISRKDLASFIESKRTKTLLADKNKH